MTHNGTFGFRRWSRRSFAALMLGGQTLLHLLQGRIHGRNTLEQMQSVGPASLSVAALTAVAVGAVFTIQVAREFLQFGVGPAIGGVLAVALSRELIPVFTAVVVAGRVGSAFAAEIGAMQVTEQIDALYMLKTDPVDYLVIPRAIACCLMLPLLTVTCFVVGMASGLAIATEVFDIPRVSFMESAQAFMGTRDIVGACIKSFVFGGLIAIIGCNWGLTTTGGAKGVGQSTTTAVVTAMIAILVANFFMSWLMFDSESIL